MSRSKHPRKKSRLWSRHKKNAKEWGGDSRWKPAERIHLRTKPRTERRSPRARSGDSGWGGLKPLRPQ